MQAYEVLSTGAFDTVALTTLPDFRQLVQTRTFLLAPFTLACTGRRFTFQRLRLTLWAWLILFPNCGPLPHISQTCAIFGLLQDLTRKDLLKKLQSALVKGKFYRKLGHPGKWLPLIQPHFQEPGTRAMGTSAIGKLPRCPRQFQRRAGLGADFSVRCGTETLSSTLPTFFDFMMFGIAIAAVTITRPASNLLLVLAQRKALSSP